MKPNDRPFQEVSVYIEQEEGTNKFKIQSNQLERLGAQLRGPRRLSVFQSALFASVATLVITYLIQYISWHNSLSLEKATDVASSARDAYESAADPIFQRHYATTVFLPDLVREAKDKVAANAKADVKNIKNAKISPPSEYASPSPHKTDLDNSPRSASYHKQVDRWNENYDRLLADIEYALDRPVFGQAKKEKEIQKISRERLRDGNLDCLKDLSGELIRLGYSSDSLKHRFAGIDKCYMDITDALEERFSPTIGNESIEIQIKKYDEFRRIKIKKLLRMANTFRCYALHRIDYYKGQKDLSIWSISHAWRLLKFVQQKDAEEHFTNTAESCSDHTPEKSVAKAP